MAVRSESPAFESANRPRAGDRTAPQIGWGEEVGPAALCRDAACDLAPSAWHCGCGPGRRDSARGRRAKVSGGHEHGHRNDDNVVDHHYLRQHNNGNNDDRLDSANHYDPRHPHNDVDDVAGTHHGAAAEAQPGGERRPEEALRQDTSPQEEEDEEEAAADEATARLPFVVVSLPR